MDTANKQLAALEAAVIDAATDEDQVAALNILAREQWVHGLTLSLETAGQARQLANEIGSAAGLIHSLCTEGFLCYQQSRSTEAHILLHKALALLQDTPDPALEAECHHFLGLVHYGAVEFETALEQFLHAQTLSQTIGLNPAKYSQLLNDLGNLYFRMDDFVRALSSYRESLAYRQTSGDRRGVATSLNNIANIYAEIQETEQAVDSYQQCLVLAHETGDVLLETRCLCNLALVYAELNRFDEAFEVSHASLALARAGGHREYECQALTNLGQTYKFAGQPEWAIPQFQQALAIAQEIGERHDECEAYLLCGECFLAVGQLTEAHTALTQAALGAETLDLEPKKLQAYLGLSEVCKQEGDFALALEFYQKFHTVQQNVLSARNADHTKSLLIQMQVEQVRRDAEIQRLRSVELAQANAALEDANCTLQTQAELLEAQAEELQAQAGELARQAAEDGLTGLANRRHLEGWLALKFRQARQDGTALTVVMADVDHFKQVNDRFGHQVGDEVLMTVALLFRQTCRASDLAARYGGEEFVLALPDTDVSQAFVLCERLRAAVQAHDWRTIHPDLSVTLSMGLSDDLDGDSHERLLGLADVQLYEAKRAGRNRISPAVPADAFIGDMSTRIPA